MKFTKRTIIIIDLVIVIANSAWGIYCWHQHSNPIALGISMFFTGLLSAMTVAEVLK